MLVIYSQYNDENVKYHIKGFKKYLDIQNLNIENLNFNKKNVLAKSSKPIRSFISSQRNILKVKVIS